MRLFFACKTGADFLTPSQKRSGVIRLLFSYLERIYEARKGRDSATVMAGLLIGDGDNSNESGRSLAAKNRARS